MKIRIGFVSNSSSSSFIIAIDKNDIDSYTSIDKLKETVFKGNDSIPSMYDCNTRLDTTKLSTMLAREISNAVGDVLDYDELVSLFRDDYTDYPSYPRSTSEECIKKYETAVNKFNIANYNNANEKAQEFITKNSGKQVCIISFGDDDDYGCQLEHSGIIEHTFNAIRFSHH